MRITGGDLKGRLVSVPPGVIRPAMDRMRESVFAHLGDLHGCSFLDLFSGSGILALEAASRGAYPVEAVEADPLKRSVLLKNVSLADQRIRCRFMPVEQYVYRARQSFALIFCDPPFQYRFKAELLERIALSQLMGTTSRLLMHHPREEQLTVRSLILRESRDYGRSRIDFFTKEEHTV
ncbi:MAG: RsmD family RNA methyltransferase [Treponema sp.]|jgi:16S rRNA (guanine(966)-N(2))-methyltransferase RsmD|nr:RsmD family RNA methyltransferase [Treponema sp.]